MCACVFSGEGEMLGHVWLFCVYLHLNVVSVTRSTSCLFSFSWHCEAHCIHLEMRRLTSGHYYYFRSQRCLLMVLPTVG